MLSRGRLFRFCGRVSGGSGFWLFWFFWRCCRCRWAAAEDDTNDAAVVSFCVDFDSNASSLDDDDDDVEDDIEDDNNNPDEADSSVFTTNGWSVSEFCLE